jgi:AcrR family transcriptional regulator
MKGKKDDRRVQYTKVAIKESFIRLLRQKPISKITVKEICQQADINRSTFYAHYTDAYDLMAQIKREVLSEIHTWIEGVAFPASGSDSHQVIKLVFEYALANSELCKVMLGEYGDISLQEEIMMIVQQQVMKEWPADIAAQEWMSQYICQFCVYASIAVVRKWLQNGLKETPGEMADLVIRLIFYGLSAPRGHA